MDELLSSFALSIATVDLGGVPFGCIGVSFSLVRISVSLCVLTDSVLSIWLVESCWEGDSVVSVPFSFSAEVESLGVEAGSSDCSSDPSGVVVCFCSTGLSSIVVGVCSGGFSPSLFANGSPWGRVTDMDLTSESLFARTFSDFLPSAFSVSSSSLLNSAVDSKWSIVVEVFSLLLWERRLLHSCEAEFCKLPISFAFV